MLIFQWLIPFLQEGNITYIMHGCMASSEHKKLVSYEFQALGEQLAIYPAL